MLLVSHVIGDLGSIGIGDDGFGVVVVGGGDSFDVVVGGDGDSGGGAHQHETGV